VKRRSDPARHAHPSPRAGRDGKRAAVRPGRIVCAEHHPRAALAVIRRPPFGHSVTVGSLDGPASREVQTDARHDRGEDGPSGFDPERFSLEREAQRRKYAHLPFLCASTTSSCSTEPRSLRPRTRRHPSGELWRKRPLVSNDLCGRENLLIAARERDKPRGNGLEGQERRHPYEDGF
jgi:hypothetical protein